MKHVPVINYTCDLPSGHGYVWYVNLLRFPHISKAILSLKKYREYSSFSLRALLEVKF